MKVVLALLVAATPALGQDPSAAVARMHAAAGLDPMLATCPSDLYRSRMPLLARLFGPGPDWPEDACASAPDACVSACLDDGSGDACFRFGLLMETSDDGDLLAGRHAHALACALGDPSGCTNRGGGIRNVPLTGDPLSLLPLTETGACLFTTFSVTCHGGNSWGCAMLGQAYENGEGTPARPDLAAISYKAACTLAAPDTEFPACVFARAGLDHLATTP